MKRLIRPFGFILDDNNGWRGLERADTAIESGRVQLKLLESLTPPLAEPHGSFGGWTLPRGVAIWGDEVFALDRTCDRIFRWQPCCGAAAHIPTIGGEGSGPRQLKDPRGLTISHRDDLIVADTGNRRLLLFTLPGLALRRIVGPLEGRGLCAGQPDSQAGPWSPVDVTAGPGGTLYVADETGSIWKLDSQCRPVACYRGRLPEGVAPRRLLVDGQGRAYVVAQDRESVLMLDRYGVFSREIASPDEVLDAETGETLRDRLPASRLRLDENRLLLAPADPCECHKEPLPTDLTLDESGRLVVKGVMAGGPYLRHRPPPATFKNSGLFRVEPLDSGRLGNPWHRVGLELSVPERTGVRLFTFTSDVPRPDLSADGLLDEPPQPGAWQLAPDNTDEALVQSPPGRYLYLALALKGPGDRTPSVERIYVYAHRQSSLAYLPAVFQADETSRGLLDRLLSLTDTIFGEIESQVEDFALHLDADGAPADFLPWLASWFDLTLEQSWSEAQRRAFLKEIVDLYRWRGTVRGLRRLLQLHANLADPMPQIVEHFRGVGQPALETWLGAPPEGDAPHHFSVLLPAYTIDTPDKRAVVQRLIDANKPAHTHFSLRPVKPSLRLGATAIRGSALGLDSVVGSHAPWQLPTDTEREGVLGIGTMLPADPLPRGIAVRLGQTRLGAPQLGCRICPPCEEL